ncbi:hypothetical protein [Intestinibacillus sp. Marseille-P6563]|uniref:hypothetical protein n=1 Tax=Intestinibacillus sp. Marseille-P6563 TaxID=2364792 RepID=UPI000F05C8C1|nr:hypothetical protein [Intestinibacillus sp. Marseille-P6563]
MPRIYVEFARLNQIGNNCKTIASRIDTIQSDFQNTIQQLDWDIRFDSNINSTAMQLARKLEQYSRALEAYQRFIEDARNEYGKLDEYKKLNLEDYISVAPIDPNKFIILGPGGQFHLDWDSIFKDIVITKPYVFPGLLSLISPITSLLYLTSGIHTGNTPSFFDYSRTPSASATANWLGYELSDDNPGVTAWVGKAGAEAQNEWGYAGVNAYLGKGEAAAKADAGIMKTTTKKEYKDGKWVEKTRTDFITAEAGASASVSALAGDAEAGLGSDMLGVEGKAEGTVGTAKAEAKGKFSVSEDGVNANVKGEAMVAAVEGEASGTINILGLEITGKVGGYAGAVGVEGKVGIEDNKFVLEGGAAALIGGSAGIEIGFNDDGWDNFVDFIVFWD